MSLCIRFDISLHQFVFFPAIIYLWLCFRKTRGLEYMWSFASACVTASVCNAWSNSVNHFRVYCVVFVCLVFRQRLIKTPKGLDSDAECMHITLQYISSFFILALCFYWHSAHLLLQRMTFRVKMSPWKKRKKKKSIQWKILSIPGLGKGFFPRKVSIPGSILSPYKAVLWLGLFGLTHT